MTVVDDLPDMTAGAVRILTGFIDALSVSDLIVSGSYDPAPGARDVGVSKAPISLVIEDGCVFIKGSFASLDLHDRIALLWIDCDVIRGVIFTDLIDYNIAFGYGWGECGTTHGYVAYSHHHWLEPMKMQS